MPEKFEFNSLSEEQQQSFREWGKLFKICNNPPPAGVGVGTIVIPTGDWMERVEAGFNFFTQIYDQQELKPHLLITGQNSSQYILPKTGADAFKIARAIRIRGRLSEEMKQQIVVDGNATNTKEQTDNTYALLQQGVIHGPLITFVSAWHFPRWYSTFVKTILTAEGEKLNTRLFSSAVFKPWNERSKDIPQIRRDRIVTEVDRIHKYREKGDVAAEEEVTGYVNWLKSQNPWGALP